MNESERVTTTTEWGYRLESGAVRWQDDYGTDGVWIGWDRASGVETIDVYDGDDTPAKISAALEKAGVTGTILFRTVTTTYGEVQVFQ